MDIQRIRNSIPALGSCTYLNCGTFGPNPTPVTDEVVRLFRLAESDGPFNPDVRETVLNSFEEARQRLAAFVGASPQEIALTRNVSDGINIVATGFDWQPGDEVIITDEEHPSGALPWINLARRYGIVVHQLPMTPDPDELIERLGALINPRTRLVFLSHVSTRRGILIPAARVCDFVHEREIPVMLDGAHATGVTPVDVKAIGCDFYAGCGHKWLLAPQGTGFLYVRAEMLDELKLTWLGWGMTSEYDLSDFSFEPAPDASRFEYATRDWALYGGLGASLKFANEIGLEDIIARTQMLTTRLKQRLSDIPGIELETPLDPSVSAGLVAFHTRGLAHENPGQWLWDEHRILVAHNPKERWMRLAAGYFLLEEEIDLVADRLSSLSRA
ncbi:MAG: aminotransferase class V-fold PLP-dependent enzyme [Chloroflexi bacterium]|nr:aminotransferase class V-fold PLP-dependent enzyme [Chloroflexota bacterium]